MRLCLFEAGDETKLAPLSLMRPVFELICGRFTLRERLFRAWDVTEWGALLRPYLSAAYREEEPEARLNDTRWLAEKPVLMIDGRWIQHDPRELPCRPEEAVFCAGRPVAFWIEPDEWERYAEIEREAMFLHIARSRSRVECPGILITAPWDLVEQNADQLRLDYRFATDDSIPFRKRKFEVLGDERYLSVSPRADVEPFVVIDVRKGPVTIEDRVKIKAFTRLEGPCHIGRGSDIFRGQITSGSTIGPVCRIGGEVENTILHGYVNKYHDGFLGHSYLCPWVNIGAQSGTSDLKFDYSEVRVPLSGELLETGLKKVGSFIGDHTKTAVNSLFDTGTSIGVMSVVLPDGDLLPRHVPSFSRYWRGSLDEGWPLEKLFAIARMAMSRRDRELSVPQEMLLRLIYDQTESERQQALTRNTPHRSKLDRADSDSKRAA